MYLSMECWLFNGIECSHDSVPSWKQIQAPAIGNRPNIQTGYANNFIEELFDE